MKTIHRCKSHGFSHLYTLCPSCGCEYCPKVFTVCPRNSWHPAHATSPEDIGNRYQAMREARAQSEANLKALGR